jgi:hypothetical protein
MATVNSSRTGTSGSDGVLAIGAPQHRAYVGNAADPSVIPAFTWTAEAAPTALLIKVTSSSPSSPASIKYVVDAFDSGSAALALGTQNQHTINTTNALTATPPYQILESTDGWFPLYFTSPVRSLYFRSLSGTVTSVFCLAVKE